MIAGEVSNLRRLLQVSAALVAILVAVCLAWWTWFCLRTGGDFARAHEELRARGANEAAYEPGPALIGEDARLADALSRIGWLSLTSSPEKIDVIDDLALRETQQQVAQVIAKAGEESLRERVDPWSFVEWPLHEQWSALRPLQLRALSQHRDRISARAGLSAPLTPASLSGYAGSGFIERTVHSESSASGSYSPDLTLSLLFLDAALEAAAGEDPELAAQLLLSVRDGLRQEWKLKSWDMRFGAWCFLHSEWLRALRGCVLLNAAIPGLLASALDEDEEWPDPVSKVIDSLEAWCWQEAEPFLDPESTNVSPPRIGLFDLIGAPRKVKAARKTFRVLTKLQEAITLLSRPGDPFDAELSEHLNSFWSGTDGQVREIVRAREVLRRQRTARAFLQLANMDVSNQQLFQTAKALGLESVRSNAINSGAGYPAMVSYLIFEEVLELTSGTPWYRDRANPTDPYLSWVLPYRR